MVGGRYYAAPQLHGLQPGTWYKYELYTGDEHKSMLADQAMPLLQCFRTLDGIDMEREQHTSPLRLVYGSCRKLDRPQDDTLNVFGNWLTEHFEQREQVWPHLLLLIGDQIYADEPPSTLLRLHPDTQKKNEITMFTDFACLYEYVWTIEKGVRQVLATIPTFMIFDDHEIHNNWGATPGWKMQMIRNGMEQVLVDGLVAYWIYQGWGNLAQSQNSQHPLLQIMQTAEKDGEDALEALRVCTKDNVYGRNELAWHYTIPTTPPIFVTNSRADRTSIFRNKADEYYAPTHIMGQQQTTALRDWMHKNDASISILVSSVPVLLPPFIGFAEYLTGVRLWLNSRIGKQFARLQLQAARRLGFDHWPAFTGSWNVLLRILKRRKKDILILGGDVHFSYAVEGRRIFAARSTARFYQLVSTPFQNTLGDRERWLIKRQSFIKQTIYGGLRTRVLHLQRMEETARIRHHLLFNNILAYVILQPQGKNEYNIEQEYMGIVEGQMVVIARTILPCKSLQ